MEDGKERSQKGSQTQTAEEVICGALQELCLCSTLVLPGLPSILSQNASWRSSSSSEIGFRETPAEIYAGCVVSWCRATEEGLETLFLSKEARACSEKVLEPSPPGTGPVWAVGSFLCDPGEEGGGARRRTLPSQMLVTGLQASQDFIPLV